MRTTLPSPKAARESIPGFRQVDLASRAGVSIQTVIRAEKSGTYPRSVAIRRAYMAALGLQEAGAK